MRIRTQGLKAHDIDLSLDRLTLLTGPNGTGKSTVAEAVRIAALGFVPRQGRRPADTAALLRERELSVSLVLDDGRVIERTLAVHGRGYRTAAQCSWLDENASSSEHAQAVLTLFGREELEVAECLDIRELLAVTENQRAARIEQLLGSQGDPKELAKLVGRYTMQRLADVADERMPADHRALRPMIRGYSAAGDHTGQYGALAEAIPTLVARLREDGIAGVTSWANESKREATSRVRGKIQARTELEERLRGLPEIDADEIATLEARRATLERTVGRMQERAAEVGRRKKLVENAERALSSAKSEAAAAQAKRAEFDAGSSNDPQLLAEVEAELDKVRPPEQTRCPEIEALKELARAAEEEARAVEIPVVPATSPIESELEGLRGRLSAARQSPWAEVEEIARNISAKIARGAKGRPTLAENVGELTGRLIELSIAERGVDLAEIERRIQDAERRLFRVGKQAQEAALARTEAITKRDSLVEKAAKAREEAEEMEGRRAREYGETSSAYTERSETLRRRRDYLRAKILDYQTQDKETAAQVTRTTAALEAAEQRWSELAEAGKPEADADTELADLPRELERVKSNLKTLNDAAAKRTEFELLVDEIDRLESERIVYAALEWGCQRAREHEIAAREGPLVAHMHRFLGGAGRSEAPYIRVDRRRSEIGWRNTAGAEVSVGALSDGEYALFAAALTAAVTILRAAPVRVLLVEAGECDRATLGQLLAGISTLAKDLTASIVMTPHRPATAVSGWNVRTPDGATLAEAA